MTDEEIPAYRAKLICSSVYLFRFMALLLKGSRVLDKLRSEWIRLWVQDQDVSGSGS